jgi:hypothetical protein
VAASRIVNIWHVLLATSGGLYEGQSLYQVVPILPLQAWVLMSGLRVQGGAPTQRRVHSPCYMSHPPGQGCSWLLPGKVSWQVLRRGWANTSPAPSQAYGLGMK